MRTSARNTPRPPTLSSCLRISSLSVEQTIGSAKTPENQIALSSSSRAVNAACQILGNFLWAVPLESSSPYVLDAGLHVPLWHIMSTSDSADLMHSSAGLLIQLARPSEQVREVIGSSEGAYDALSKLCHPRDAAAQARWYQTAA